MKRIFAHIGFSFALSLIILNFMGVEWALAVLAAAGVLLIFSIFCRKTRQAAAVPVCLISVVLASLVFIVNHYNSVLPQQKLDGETVSAVIYKVDLESRTSSGGYAYTVKTKSIDMPEAPQNIKLMIYSDEPIYAESYDVINADISLFSAGDNAYDSNGAFGNGIFLRGYLNHYSATEEKVVNLNKYILELREKLNDRFDNIISGDEGALSLAVLTGDTSNLSEEVYSNFKACGATHLMAVSGFNLAVISGALYKILRRLLVPRAPAVIVCSASVLFYVMLSGFSKSMVRSAVMMLVFLLSKLIKERSDALNSLGFAAFLVCLDPFAVADAGALLTFTAVLGLTAVNPNLSLNIDRKHRLLRSIADTFTASVSVFITTFPVMYFIFGSTSILGIFLNIILIPLTEILLLSSLFFVLFMFLSPVMLIFANINFYISAALITITRVCARLSFATVNISDYRFGLIIFCVLFIFGVGFMLRKENSKKIFKLCTVLSCAVCVLILAVTHALSRGDVYARILHGERSNSVIIYDDSYAAVICPSEYAHYYRAENIILSKDLEVVMIIEGDKEYSLKLAEKTDCMNYITSDADGYTDGEIYEYNISANDSFASKLWSAFTVDYKTTDDGRNIKAVIYETEFDFSSYTLAIAEKYDIIYTVDENGYSMKGVNEWAE